MLKKDELHIWWYTLNEQDYCAEERTPLLSKEEIDRAECYLNECDKVRYICNHRFVRKVLSKYLNLSPSEIEFSYSAMGKPFVKNSNLFFNYSYRKNYCILAISNSAEVGIDIEWMKPLQDVSTFVSYSFSEKEKEIIYASDDKNFMDTLFVFWTFKEAMIKSLGVGLNADLTQIDLSSYYYSKFNPLAFDSNNFYTLSSFKAPEGFKSAFAIKGSLSQCCEFDFKEN